MTRFLLVVMCASIAFFAPLAAQEPAASKPKEVQWSHAFDLACRKLGEEAFSKDTQKFGVEAYKDLNTDLGLYISQTGSLIVAGGFDLLKLPMEGKGPEWKTGLDLPARTTDETDFSAQTPFHSLEVFRDPNTNNWLYLTEKGEIASAAVRGGGAGRGGVAPRWILGYDLNARKAGAKDWKDAVKISIEVYRDGNTGSLIYITQTGAIAAVPDGGDGNRGEAKAPQWLHALNLACRKSTEPTFTKATTRLGIEVYRDENNHNLIFLCENGNIAVTNGPAELKTPTEKVQEPQWSHGVNLKVRSIGEKEFTDKTRTYGGEVFRDPNVGATLVIGETGTVSAYRKGE